MADAGAFLAACARPYDDERANCLQAAAAAFPSSQRVAALLEWYENAADDLRRYDPNTVQQRAVQEAEKLGFKPWRRLTAYGNQIALVTTPAGPVFAAGLQNGWFARGNAGAYRVHWRRVLVAWSVD